jgi:hypothetical protein
MANQEQPNQIRSPRPTRPRMPSSYRIDRGETGMIPWSTIDDRLATARNYWVVTSGPDRRPHATPVWGVWFDQTFYFSTDPASRKGRHLATNPEIVVHLESGDDVVILEGTVSGLTDPASFQRYADAYEAKYQFRPEASDSGSGVYALRPRVAYAWEEKDFPRTATRWVFDRP